MVVEKGLRGLHHLVQHEQVLHVVCDLLGDEAQQIGRELMDARFGTNSSKRSILPLDIGLVGESARQLCEQLLGLLGQYVFDERLDVDIVQAVGCGQMRVRVGAFG